MKMKALGKFPSQCLFLRLRDKEQLLHSPHSWREDRGNSLITRTEFRWNTGKPPLTAARAAVGKIPIAGQVDGALMRGATGLAPNGSEKDREVLGDLYREAPNWGNKELKWS